MSLLKRISSSHPRIFCAYKRFYLILIGKKCRCDRQLEWRKNNTAGILILSTAHNCVPWWWKEGERAFCLLYWEMKYMWVISEWKLCWNFHFGLFRDLLELKYKRNFYFEGKVAIKWLCMKEKINYQMRAASRNSFCHESKYRKTLISPSFLLPHLHSFCWCWYCRQRL